MCPGSNWWATYTTDILCVSQSMYSFAHPCHMKVQNNKSHMDVQRELDAALQAGLFSFLWKLRSGTWRQKSWISEYKITWIFGISSAFFSPIWARALKTSAAERLTSSLALRYLEWRYNHFNCVALLDIPNVLEPNESKSFILSTLPESLWISCVIEIMRLQTTHWSAFS